MITDVINRLSKSECRELCIFLNQKVCNHYVFTDRQYIIHDYKCCKSIQQDVDCFLQNKGIINS